MLAVAYLVLMVAFGDAIARPFFGDVSRVQRVATAFLVGLLVSTWLTYLVALVFSGVEQPLIPADAVVAWLMALVAAIRVIPIWQHWRTTGETPLNSNRWSYGVRQSERWDWILITAIGVFIAWMMVSTFNVSDGRLNIAVPLWSDFGPTTAIAQSFAVGHNYPTQYPHFAGPAILYHFLFYFQVGNLTFLGLDPGTANNVLSIGALTSMLALVMALGIRLFHSRATGWIAAILFFFHGALSFIPYLASFASPADALAGVTTLDHYLASGFPYRGEEWGIWTQNVFLNQRHLSSAIGIVLIALLFVVDRLQVPAGAIPSTVPAADPAADPDDDPVAAPIGGAIPSTVPAVGFVAAARDRLDHPISHVLAGIRDPALPSYLAAGLLLGLLPLWNSPMFIAGAALFGVVFVVFPNRVQMAALAVAAAVPAIPQILFLRPSGLPGTAHFPTFHWGYIVDPPTLVNVVTYLGFIFGLKLLLVAVGLVATGSLQRRIFLAACSLVAVAFLVQFSVEVFANHKFLNAWLIIANVFAAYGLLRLWGLRFDRVGPIANFAIGQAARSVAVILAGAIVVGGVVDFVPIARVQSLSFPLAGDPLYDWVAQETKPTDVFLTDLYVTSPILLAGRAIYYGWPYYAWSAGYDTDSRQALYVRMLQSRDPAELLRLLQDNHIAYVAIDDGLRHNTMVPNLNEDVYRATFKVAFEDTEGKYQNIVIFQVPGGGSGGSGGPTGSGTPAPAGSGPPAPSGPTPLPVSLFTGGRGSGPGQFIDGRGLAVGPDGDIMLADPGNDRIQRFAGDGTFVASFGQKGSGPGQMNGPNGVAVDPEGHVFVVDTFNQRLQEFDAGGAFISESPGPAPGFYGPRDAALDATNAVYVLDQGHARVVRLPVTGDATSFGSLGAGPGQLNEPTGIAVAGELVYVADKGNTRIAVFGTDGQYVRSIAVPEWSPPGGYPDVAVSADGRFLLASSPATAEVLVFTIDGARAGSLKTTAPDVLTSPGAMAIQADGRVLVVDFEAARVTQLPPPGP